MNILSMGDRPNPCNLVEYSGFIRFVNVNVVNNIDWSRFVNHREVSDCCIIKVDEVCVWLAQRHDQY